MIDPRENAASALRAARASLDVAIDHYARAAEPETFPGQRDIRTGTAAEETQAAISHATLALYWFLRERMSR